METASCNSSSRTWETDDLVSDVTLYIFTYVNYVILGGSIGVVGVALNVINMVVFARLGYSETTNITLSAISAADTGVLLMMLGYAAVYNPAVLASINDVGLINAINYVILGWPHVLFGRISGCLTTFITVERFIAVAHPLHVRRLVTPARTAVVCFVMVLVPLLATTPAFVGFRIGLTFDPSSNSSMLGLVAETSSGLLETISLLTNVFIQFLTYFLVMGFASGLIKVSEWRKSTSTASQNSSLTSRDTRLVKVIALISAVFVVCSTPAVLGSVAMMLVRDFSVTGRYKNLFVASFSTFFLLESVNATVNFFIYLNTSSKFKVELGSMIGLKLK